MEYGRIARRSWDLSWRNRFLWPFGLLVGTGTCGGNAELPSPDAADLDGRALEGLAGEAGAWVGANTGLVLLVAAVFALLAVALIVLGVIARGGLIASLAHLSRGEPASLGSSWRTGRHLAWRYVRLWLLVLAMVLLALLVGAVVVGVLVLLGTASDVAAVLAVVLGVVLLVPAALLGLALSVAVTYAERAIAIDGMSARQALARGLALLRVRLGHSVILWLIALAVGLVASAVVATGAVLLALPLGTVIVGAYLASGLSGPTVALAAIGLLLLVAGVGVLGGIAGTYMAAFWTLAYLTLTDRMPVAEPGPR